ncbi:hypothetical protein NQD34_003546 [Periophthalmus magnuspinnatus]|nr:hypothetical protein NQD34_003546 [Periophthalmus magnuspinnatus]
MVTTQGTSLNPNAQVWQEVPVLQTDALEVTEDSAWISTYPPPIDFVEDYSEFPSPDGKDFGLVYPDGSDYGSDYDPAAPEVMGGTCDYPDLAYLVFEPPYNGTVEEEVMADKTLSEENLRESLKKQLEFYFSRENLSKDLYLISQMDSDQFVPIWTIACMEDIKSLTSDLELIVDVLKTSPLVQVDESGEKVRPNYSRCIIILREVPETTPVEEVEALFNNENCPKTLSAEFAHNSNWYITFQSDNDALQALKYLREEVKIFQGKPIMARIKAINTFFGKSGFHSVDSSVFSQPAPPPQTQTPQPFGSPVYIDMQQVYSPQPQYPVYPVVSPSWSPTPVPYFETPLAPFQNSGYMNGYRGSGNYKGNSLSVNGHGPRSSYAFIYSSTDTCSNEYLVSMLVLVSDFLHSPKLKHTWIIWISAVSDVVVFAVAETRVTQGPVASWMSLLRLKYPELPSDPPQMPCQTAPPPNFDLAACNFPPLPGSVVTAKEETALDVCMADVVRGLKVRTSNLMVNMQNYITFINKYMGIKLSFRYSSSSESHKDDTEVDTQVSNLPSETSVSEEPQTTTSQSATTVSAPAPPPTSEPEPKKLSYAEVCQRLAKDPPSIQPSPPYPSSPSPPAPQPNQPLQELKVNRVQEPRNHPNKHNSEKPRNHQHPRHFRGSHDADRPAPKNRDRPRNFNKSFSAQRGSKRSGKEQNIPPSPK